MHKMISNPASHLSPDHCYLRQLYNIGSDCVEHILELVDDGDKSLHAPGWRVRRINWLFSWWSQSHSMSHKRHHCNNTHRDGRRRSVSLGSCSSPVEENGFGEQAQAMEKTTTRLPCKYRDSPFPRACVHVLFCWRQASSISKATWLIYLCCSELTGRCLVSRLVWCGHSRRDFLTPSCYSSWWVKWDMIVNVIEVLSGCCQMSAKLA